MDSLHLHKQWPSDVTLVPNLFLDKYMLRANGEFVKIYMYLLRSIQGEKLSLSMLADSSFQSCLAGIAAAWKGENAAAFCKKGNLVGNNV